jgi:hypothetical protein
MKLISRTKLIIDKLRKEGKVTDITLTYEQSKEYHEQMIKIKEDSRRKQMQSWQSAKDVWLD